MPVEMITEDEFAIHGRRTSRAPHPLCVLLRQLRHAARLSLKDMEDRHGIAAVVLGAYERGDREPPLRKIDKVLEVFGYQLQAVPIDTVGGMPANAMVTNLRAIADQLEEEEHDRDLPDVPSAAA